MLRDRVVMVKDREWFTKDREWFTKREEELVKEKEELVRQAMVETGKQLEPSQNKLGCKRPSLEGGKGGMK